MSTITLRGTPIQLDGQPPAVGRRAPGFRLVDAQLRDVVLKDFAGKQKVLNFNDGARHHPDAVMLMISADLPFAMARFCGSEGLENVVPLSMMRGRNFSKDYGVLMEAGPLAGLAARACMVLDADNIVRHVEVVAELSDEPDYEAALAALKG